MMRSLVRGIGCRVRYDQDGCILFSSLGSLSLARSLFAVRTIQVRGFNHRTYLRGEKSASATGEYDLACRMHGF
jgi:hypothetical protein